MEFITAHPLVATGGAFVIGALAGIIFEKIRMGIAIDRAFGRR